MLRNLLERAVLFTAKARRFVVRFLRARAPAPCGVLLAVPVKTLAALNFVGTVCIIFGTARKMDASSFGGTCCALCVLCVVLGGARSANGMPAFEKVLAAGNSENIFHYVISRANEDKAIEEAKAKAR